MLVDARALAAFCILSASEQQARFGSGMQPSEHSLISGGRSLTGLPAAWWRSVRSTQTTQGCRRLNCNFGRGLLLGSCSGIVAGGVVASASLSKGIEPQPPKPQRQRGLLDFGSPLRRCTDALLVTNALLFAAQWLTRDAITLWGAKVNALIAAGQIWRLLTSSLLHTSLFHLLVNSHALHTIGPHLEVVSGRGRFMAVYVAGALVGTAASFVFTPAPSVGASAALFGLGAALGVFYWRHKGLLGERSDYVLKQLGFTLAVNMAYSLANRRVDNWGHLGGMAGGAAVAWLLGPRFVRDSTTGRVQDQPPWPLLAHSQQPGGVVGATIRGLLVAGQPGEGEGGKGRKGKGGKGRGKKLQEQAQEAAREGAGDEQQ